MNALTLSYIITGILVLTGIKPLVIAGILFAVCYLPGLVLITVLKKNALEMEDVILAFPGSVGISTLLTLGLLFAGIHVGFIAYIIYGLSGVALLIHMIRPGRRQALSINISSAEGRFIVFAFLAVLVFSIPVIAERIAISHHGFHHLSLVTRIFNGFFPPENPGLGGAAIGYHWGYHALVAAISFPADLHPLRVFSVLNIISLFFLFCISYRSAKIFGFSEGFSFLVPLALIGMMRSDSIFFFLQKLISGEFPVINLSDTEPLNTLASWIWGVSYLDTRLIFMNKFYNANNMPIGLCLIFAFFMLLLLSSNVKRANERFKIDMVILLLILSAVAVTYAFFLIIPLFFVPVWAAVLFFTNPGTRKERNAESIRLIVPCIVAALITIPYLLAITHGKSVVTGGQSMDEFRFLYLNEQTIKNLIVFLLPSPVIFAGFWFAFKELSLSRKSLFLLSGSLIFLLLAAFLRLNWGNSAKFSYILSFFFSFLFVFSVRRVYLAFSNKMLGRGWVALAALFLCATPVLTEAAYVASPWFDDDTYIFNGKQVVFGRESSRNEGYEWIRDNTPHDALLLLPYFETPFSPGGITLAQSFSYRPVALTERSLFVIKDVYAYVASEYTERVSVREQIFKDPGDQEVRQYIRSLGRPIYLLVEEGYEDPLMKGVEPDEVTDKVLESFDLVFENEQQRVYRMKYAAE